MAYTGFYIRGASIESHCLYAAFFMLCGKALKKHDTLSPVSINLSLFATVALGSIICPSSMLSFTVKDLIPYTVCALAGTLLTLNFSRFLNRVGSDNLKRLLLFIGENTLIILTFHFFAFKLVSLCIIAMHELPIEELAYFPIIPKYGESWWPMYSLVGIGIPLAVKWIINQIRNHYQSWMYRS